MAVIGTLAVSLIAKSQEFVSGLGKARDAVMDFASAIPGIGFATSKVGVALELLAGGAMVAMAHATAESIDKVAKLADRLGTTTEAVTGLDHAARINGSSAEEMNAALDKLARGLGKAEEGGKAAAESLAHLGLAYGDLLGKDPSEQIRVIADRINALGTQEEKVAATTNLFGKSAANLVNVLAGGRAGLDAMQQEAQKLGITFTRFEAAKVEQANDALTRMHEILQGLMQRAVIELAPYVEAIVKKFEAWATSGKGIGEKVTGAIETVIVSMERVVQLAQIARGSFMILAGGATTAIFGLATAILYVGSLLEKLANLLPGVDFHPIEDAKDFMAEATVEAAKLTKEGYNLVASSGDAAAATHKFFADAARDSKTAAEATAKAADANRAGAAAGAQVALQDEQKEAAEKKAAKSAEDHAKALERQKEAMEQQAEQREIVSKLSKEDRKFATEIVEIEKARKNGWDELVSRLEAALAAKREEVAIEDKARLAEKAKEVRDAVAETVREREKLGALTKEERQWGDELLEIERTRAKGLGELADRMQKILDGKKAELAIEQQQAKVAEAKRKAADEAVRKAKEQEDLLKSMNREIELLQAGNDLERERIRIQQELEDHLEKSGKNEAARDASRLLAAEKLKNVAESAADKAERSAAATSRTESGSGGGGGTSSDSSGGHLAGGAHRKAKGQRDPFMGTFGPVRVVDREAEWQKQHAREVAAANEQLARDPYAFTKNAGKGLPPPGSSTSAAAAAPAAATSTGTAAAAGGAAHPVPDPSPELQKANEKLDELVAVLKTTTEALTSTGEKLEQVVKGATDMGEAAAKNDEAIAAGVGKVQAAVDRLGEALKTIQQSMGGH